MTLTAWMQERFWAGFALMAGRAGISEKVDKLVADKLEAALDAEIAKMEAEAAAEATL